MDEADLDDELPRAGRRRRIAIIASLGALAVAAIAVVLIVTRSDGADAPKLDTVAVDRGDVVATLAGVGTLRSGTTASLTFSLGGRVTSVSVSPGQHVVTGQVLATLDDRVARAHLAAAEASVIAGRAALTQLMEGRSGPERRQSAAQIEAAAGALRSSSRLVRSARRIAAADVRGQQTALRLAVMTHRSAERRLERDSARLRRFSASFTTLDQQAVALRNAVGQLRDRQLDRARTRRDHLAGQIDATNTRAAAEAALSDARSDLVDARTILTTANANVSDACRTPAPSGPAVDCASANTAAAAARAQVATAQTRVDSLQGAVDGQVESTTSAQKALLDDDVLDAELTRQLDAAQGRLSDALGDRDRVRASRDGLRTSVPTTRDAARTAAQAVDTARRTLASGRANANQSLDTAGQSLDAARSALDVARATAAVDDQPPRPAAITTARQTVATAESAVADAEQDLESTVLRAPADGVVAKVALATGDTVSGGAPMRGGAGAATSGAGGGDMSGGGDGAVGDPSKEGQNIVINGGRPTLFSVPLTQADVIRARIGDPATVLPHATRQVVKGRLIRLTPAPASVNGVVTYAATVIAPRTPRRLEPGMTADVTIQAARRDNVIRAPVSAIQATGRTGQVTVVRGTRTADRPVTLGLQGDRFVEILSGLRPGDRIALASAPPSFGGP